MLTFAHTAQALSDTASQMNTPQVESLVEDLSGHLDDLESSLAPLLNQALSSTTSRLPLLDKAKIYVLATYAIESLLFSYLRLNGVDAKKHAVFHELTRVKAYFEKLKLAESGPAKRTTTLDKGAASRFIKHGLAGNDKLDRYTKRRAADMEETSQWGSANRFAGTAKRIQTQDLKTVPVVRAADVDVQGNTQSKASSVDDNKSERKAAKRQRRQQAALAKQSPSTDQRTTSIADERFEASSAAPQPAATYGSLPETIASKVHKKRKKQERESEADSR